MKQMIEINTSTVIAIIGTLISLGSFIGTLIIVKITRRRENHQNLLQQISNYSKPEMHSAIKRLWNLYRDYGQHKLVENYIEIMNRENQKSKTIRISDRLKYEITTIHYQRRMITTFYRGLGMLLRNNLIPKKETYEYWAKTDVEIVDKIIIPIENKLGEELNVTKINKKTDPLCYIVKMKNKFYK
jgi:hypothetical protein